MTEEVEKVRKTLSVEGLPSGSRMTITLITPDGKSHKVTEIRK